MSQELIKAERAALIQSVKALYIPLSLFIACVISAGGMYMVFYTEDKTPGYAFLAVAFTIIISAFIALIRFQNNYRAKGVIGRAEASGQDEVQAEVQDDFQDAARGETSNPRSEEPTGSAGSERTPTAAR